MPAGEGEGERRRALRDWVPRWWRGEAGAMGVAADAALWPAEQLYRTVMGARNRLYDVGALHTTEPPIPVISVGNIGVGGAGKTPVAAWMVARLREWGRHPALVLRGYGEDEILVHRELNPDVPVIAATRRIDAVREAARGGADVAVVDDGFQHRALGRRLDVVLLAAESWRPPLRLLPRGPWREGLPALARADVLLVTRKSAPEEAAKEIARALAPRVGGRVARCHLAPTALAPLRGGTEEPLEGLRGREVLAVASLADPRPFARQVEAAGARVELLAFPDHHAFSAGDATLIRRTARERTVVMTRKDAVKLRPLLEGIPALVLEQRVVMESGAELLEECLREAAAPEVGG